MRFSSTIALTILLLARGTAVAVDQPEEQPAREVSPFLPAGGASTPAAAAQPSSYQLAGVLVMGGETQLSISRSSDKTARWIPVGKTVDGILAEKFDEAREEAVIVAEGRRQTLQLRTTAKVAPGMIATASPGKGQQGKPRTQAEEEREARMLVSDLLEIGVEQRKAYEKARQQAAKENPR